MGRTQERKGKAIPWGYIAAATIGSALLGSDAASNAADVQAGAARDAASQNAAATDRATEAQAEATKQSLAEQARQYDLTRSDLAPFRAAGLSAMDRIAALASGAMPTYTAPTMPNGPSVNLSDVTQSDIMNDPVYAMSYQAGLNMGRDAINKAAAARGGMIDPRTGVPTGGMLKDLTSFATDYTAGKAGDAYSRIWGQRANQSNLGWADANNRFNLGWNDTNNRFNLDWAALNNRANLNNPILGVGSGANNTGVNAAMNYGQNVGNTVTSGADRIGQMTMAGANANANLATSAAAARAAGLVGGANAWGNAATQGMNMYSQDRILNMLGNRNNPSYQTTVARDPILNDPSFYGVP